MWASPANAQDRVFTLRGMDPVRPLEALGP
jgi:hypothetical protein